MSRLLILGAGGHGRVIADIAQDLGWNTIAFLDDAPLPAPPLADCPLLGPLSLRHDLGGQFDAAVVAIGNNALRLSLINDLTAAGWMVPSLVHPAATVSRHATLGTGCVICAGAVVGISACLGPAVIVNTGATVDHDCVVGDGAHISPGAHIGGTTTIGARTWIGIGAAVSHSLTIGHDCVIGAGAAVIRDIPPGVRAVGVPAAVK